MKLSKILRWIWEFPQCLLGIILTKYYNVEYKETYKGIDIYAGNFPGGISLGQYILMEENIYKYNRNQTKDHEYGHTRQSIRLGWFYLLIIGLPSLIWAWRWKPNTCISYYSFWTEVWADKLGGVIR